MPTQITAQASTTALEIKVPVAYELLLLSASSHGDGRGRASPSPKRLRHKRQSFQARFQPHQQSVRNGRKARHDDNQQNSGKRTSSTENPFSYVFCLIKKRQFYFKSSSGAGDRPRTMHRLPAATNVRDIDITLSMSKTATSWTLLLKVHVVARAEWPVQKIEVRPKTSLTTFFLTLRLIQADKQATDA